MTEDARLTITHVISQKYVADREKKTFSVRCRVYSGERYLDLWLNMPTLAETAEENRIQIEAAIRAALGDNLGFETARLEVLPRQADRS